MNRLVRPPTGPGAPLVVLLHGYMGQAEDLEPFARSLGGATGFVFPQGPVDLAPRGMRGRAWWPVDVDARAEALARGPRDLSRFFPDGLDEAREGLAVLLDEVGSAFGPRPLVLGGFSQGAMLSCDLALRTPRAIDGLVMFSGARIAHDAWRPLYSTRRGLRAFVSHGRDDDDLAFTAADAFRRELESAGWDVAWHPFDGGHEIPFLVWRAFRRWLER